MTRAVAEELANARGSGVLDGLATRRDMQESAARSDSLLRETELRLRQDMKDLELRVTVRLGAMLAGTTALTIAILGALVEFK